MSIKWSSFLIGAVAAVLVLWFTKGRKKASA